MMDIFKGKCVICCENTFVVSGKDKQTFLALLKEHYFDVNQIKNDKFLLQFKEKRSEKSVCISCAHIIECYVSIRTKFKEQGKRTAKKCFICNSTNNLAHGTTELIKDASTLLKNVNKSTKAPRLTLICIECSFCIISWNKLKDLITKYLLETEDSNDRHSADDSSSASESTEMNVAKNKPSVRRTRKMTIEDRKDTAMSNGARKVKKSKSVKDTHNSISEKKKLKITNELEEQVKHLTNVSAQISSKDILLGKKMIKRVTSDERMMFDIAYISCKTKNLESLLKNTDKSGNQRESSDKNRPLKLGYKRKSNYQSDDSDSENRPSAIKLKKKRLSNKQSEVSDSENQSSKNLESLKNKRKKTSRKPPTKNIKTRSNNNSSEMTENKRRKSPRKNKSFDESEVILLSDTDSNSELDKKTKIKPVNITPVRISLRTRSSRGAQMQKENNKREIKNKAPSRKNQCSTCDKNFVKKYRLQLHELEHEASFQPVVRVRKRGNRKSSDAEGKTTTDDSEVDENQIKDKQSTENNNFKKDSQKENGEEKESADENEILDDSIKQVVNETLLQLEKDIDENSKETPDKKDESKQSSFSQDDETAYSDISDGDKNTDHAKKKPKTNEKAADTDEENNGSKEDNTNSEEQTETAGKNTDHTKKKPKKNVRDKKIEKDDSSEEDNSNSEEQTETADKNTDLVKKKSKRNVKDKKIEKDGNSEEDNSNSEEQTETADKNTDLTKKKPKRNVKDKKIEKDDNSEEDNSNSEEQIETADKNTYLTKKKPKRNVKGKKIEKDDNSEEDNSNSEEQTENSNKNSGTKETINEIIETQDSENEANDETTQQSENETSDEIQEKINEETGSQVSENTSKSTEDIVNDNDNQTNEETNNDKADSVQCDKQIETNNDKTDSVQYDKQIEKKSQDSAEDDSSSNFDKNVDNNVVEINEKNNVTKESNGLKSVVIEDDSSNSSDKDDEIEKDKLIEKNNQQSVVIDVDSSDSSDKEEETEKDKNIEENESVLIEDSLSNSDKIEDDTVMQNKEKPLNDIIESSQTTINDKETVKDSENNLNNETETAEISAAGNESEDNSQSIESIDKTILIEEDEMEPLHISPESVNSQNGKLCDNAMQKTLDKYETVESLLQNLGA